MKKTAPKSQKSILHLPTFWVFLATFFSIFTLNIFFARDGGVYEAGGWPFLLLPFALVGLPWLIKKLSAHQKYLWATGITIAIGLLNPFVIAGVQHQYGISEPMAMIQEYGISLLFLPREAAKAFGNTLLIGLTTPLFAVLPVSIYQVIGTYILLPLIHILTYLYWPILAAIPIISILAGKKIPLKIARINLFIFLLLILLSISQCTRPHILL